MNPYLNSKFDLLDRGGGPRRGIVFGSQLHERSGRTFRRWMQLWLKQLALNASGISVRDQVTFLLVQPPELPFKHLISLCFTAGAYLRSSGAQLD